MKDIFTLRKIARFAFWIAIVTISIDASMNFLHKNYYLFSWKSLVIFWMVYSTMLECRIDTLKDSVKRYKEKLKLDD